AAWLTDAISLLLPVLPGCPRLSPKREASRNRGGVYVRVAWLIDSLLGHFANPETPARHTDPMTDSPQTATAPSRDAQAETPATPVRLSRVAVRAVEKTIRVGGSQTGGAASAEPLYPAALECFVALNPEQAGVHMSRFEEVVNEAIDPVVLSEALRAE